MARIIRISNLSDSVDGHALRQLFEAYGAVRRAMIHRHFETGRSTGGGFIEMDCEADGAEAIAALNHHQHLGRALSVCWGSRSDASIEDHNQMFGPTNMTSEEATGRRSSKQ